MDPRRGEAPRPKAVLDNARNIARLRLMCNGRKQRNVIRRERRGDLRLINPQRIAVCSAHCTDT
eukprot:7651225-Heterocapsa_arctica.AAC.1